MPFLLQAPTSSVRAPLTVAAKSTGELPKSRSADCPSGTVHQSCSARVAADSRTTEYDRKTADPSGSGLPVVTQTEVPSVAALLQMLPPTVPAGVSKYVRRSAPVCWSTDTRPPRIRWASQFAARPMKIRPPRTVGDDQLKYSAAPDAVAGPIARDQRCTPVAASSAYSRCAPAA